MKDRSGRPERRGEDGGARVRKSRGNGRGTDARQGAIRVFRGDTIPARASPEPRILALERDADGDGAAPERRREDGGARVRTSGGHGRGKDARQGGIRVFGG